MKHEGPAPTTVVVGYGGDPLDDAPVPVDDGSPGHGIVGMRERVAVFGGRLDARPRPAGGFALRAHIPLLSEGDR